MMHYYVCIWAIFLLYQAKHTQGYPVLMQANNQQQVLLLK